jgi:hypothetical protein
VEIRALLTFLDYSTSIADIKQILIASARQMPKTRPGILIDLFPSPNPNVVSFSKAVTHGVLVVTE